MQPPWKRRSPDKLARSGDVRGLLAALTPKRSDFFEESTGFYDVGWQRRADAARHLADRPGEEVTAGLSTALADVTPAVRLEALRSLAGRPDAPDEEVVARVLVWPADEARAAAEAVLAERAEHEPAAAARMLDAYVAAEDGDGELSDAWVRDVMARADQAGARGVVERATAVAMAGGAEQPRAGQVLAAGAEHAVPALLPELSRDRARLPAIRLLGRLRHQAATPSLVELLEDGAPDVRHAAVAALGEIKDPHTIDALLRRTADDDYGVRDAAMRALDGFGTTAVVWGLASVARGVLTGVTGDDWMRELPVADPTRAPKLPVPFADHVDAESQELAGAPAEGEIAPVADAPPAVGDDHTPQEPVTGAVDAGDAPLEKPTVVRRRRGFFR